MLLVHGGAGTLFQNKISEEREAEYRSGIKAALLAGQAKLAIGGSSLEAVETAVKVLEDNPLFNAGKGAVFNHEGHHEMDAAIMDGKSRGAGAIALVKRVKNPISLARKVLDFSPHVFLAGDGAEAFAQAHGISFEDEEYFFTDYRYRQWVQIRDSDKSALDHSELIEDKEWGTVGAVAQDHYGNLAAATSTGGMTNKRFGRIGDSPLIGAGTYADNTYCAVSATGNGEFFIRSVFAYDIAARMAYKGQTLKDAARESLSHLEALGGKGGLIAVDAQGNFTMPFNTSRMYRGVIFPEGNFYIDIY